MSKGRGASPSFSDTCRHVAAKLRKRAEDAPKYGPVDASYVLNLKRAAEHLEQAATNLDTAAAAAGTLRLLPRD